MKPSRLKVVTVVGTRPQFVKASMVSRAFRSHPEIQEILVHTGQHYDSNLSEIFFAELGIPEPSFHLGIGSGTHGYQIARMLEPIEQVLIQEQPAWVLVYGDTNSTLAGALAASKLHLPLAHIEAGLRSFNRNMPEELNRVLTDHASDLLFPPTDLAERNLRTEGIAAERIRLVGDVMCDAARYFQCLAERQSTILDRFQLDSQRYILATVHRAENTDCGDRLRTILRGLDEAATGLPIIFPLHPRTRSVLANLEGFTKLSERLRFVDPVGYLDMAMLERNARLIVTDSGGVQKEAFFYSVPCVTLRTETEWQELIELGWNRLAPPTSANSVATALQKALTETPRMSRNPYGDGHAAEHVVQHLLTWRSAERKAGVPARSAVSANVAT